MKISPVFCKQKPNNEICKKKFLTLNTQVKWVSFKIIFKSTKVWGKFLYTIKT